MNLEDKSDEDLMELSAGQNGVSSMAFGIIYERYHKRVEGYVYNFFRNREKAEDLTQDVFCKINENPSLYKKFSNSKFKSWIFTLARNATINEMKKLKNKFTDTADFSEKDFLHPGYNMYDDFEQKESFEILHSKMEKLNYLFYDVLNKEYFKDMSYGEIAERVGEKVGTIKSRIHFAKKKMEKLISSEYAERRPKI